MQNKIYKFITSQIQIAPLSVFRIVFGAILFLSTIRFILKGWVHELYVEPKFYFTYYGFEWVQPFSEPFMYVIFGLLVFSALCLSLGLFYRLSSVLTFSIFTYVELIDKTNYLNHYYFVSLVLFLLIFVPANKNYSLDVKWKLVTKVELIPHYFIFIFKLLLAIVYFYAGLAKLNYDWLVNAMPLAIWLPAKSNIPFIGSFLQEKWVAYFFSWFGALYDLSIPFFLFWKRSRPLAYFFVIVFHLATWILFPIGVFPFVMIGATLIFFSANFHLKLIQGCLKTIGYFSKGKLKTSIEIKKQIDCFEEGSRQKHTPLLFFFTLFFIIQLAIPFRYSLYNNNLYWTEEGYRFSWRVMLMEKAGYAIFHIKNPENGREWEVNNYEHLTPNQEKMMSTQADMILQFAHYLEKFYQTQGIKSPVITAEVYATLNGKQSQLLINSAVDLTKINESFAAKRWILPFNNNEQAN